MTLGSAAKRVRPLCASRPTATSSVRASSWLRIGVLTQRPSGHKCFILIRSANILSYHVGISLVFLQGVGFLVNPAPTEYIAWLAVPKGKAVDVRRAAIPAGAGFCRLVGCVSALCHKLDFLGISARVQYRFCGA